MFKRALLLVALVLAGIVAFAATRPDSYRVERQATIAAPVDVVYGQLADFRKWAAWSPWEKLDPNLKKSYQGTPGTVGASYAWQGNDKVGKGRMTIVDAHAPNALGLRLEFIEPFAAVASTKFALASNAPSTTNVTWSMEGTNTLMGKVFGLFMNMDKTIGGDFERGLGGLKTAAEADAAAAKK
jgi:hypothetical protein